jgi:hypothetical protein
MKKVRLTFSLIPFLALFFGGVALAQYSSTNYKSNEVFFGSGGDTGQSSTNYKAQASVGSLGVGQYSSNNYQAFTGFLTPNEPFLEMAIDSGPVNLGTLSTTTAATATATFHVRAYIDSGYTVQTVSQPPSYTSGSGSHTLAGMSQGASSVGTEQFGINMVGPNNLGAGNFGSNPAPQPNSTYAFGQAASGYSTTNQFKYSAGDTIACTGTGGTCGNASGWGQTNYTISYIANISLITPAGSYSVVQDLVVVATY